MLPDIVHKANEDIDTNWVYILKLKNNMYKFGITLHLRKRLQTHNREKHPDGIIKMYPLPTYNMCMSVEGKIKDFTKRVGINLFKEKTHEYFKSTDEYPEEDIITIIGQIVNEEIITDNKNSEIQKLKVQNDLLRSLVLTKFPLQENNVLIDKLEKHLVEENPKKLLKCNRKTDHCTCDSIQRRDNNICIYCTSRNKVLESIKNGRPTYKNLKDELKQTSYTKMSIKYKVSPTTIKKWIRMCEKYKLT
jgi:predicted GIY-YIG superfamily endonuclease